MSVAVKFVGGPADGVLMLIPGDPWNPPQTYEIAVPGTVGHGAVKLLYSREVSPEDDGPLWLYRYPEEHVQ